MTMDIQPLQPANILAYHTFTDSLWFALRTSCFCGPFSLKTADRRRHRLPNTAPTDTAATAYQVCPSRSCCSALLPGDALSGYAVRRISSPRCPHKTAFPHSHRLPIPAPLHDAGSTRYHSGLARSPLWLAVPWPCGLVADAEHRLSWLNRRLFLGWTAPFERTLHRALPYTTFPPRANMTLRRMPSAVQNAWRTFQG